MNWKAYQKRRDTHQSYAERRVMRGLRQQIQYVLEALPEGASQTLGNLPYLFKQSPLEDAYKDIYGRVGKDFAERSFRNLKSTGPTLTKDLEDNWLEHMRNFAAYSAGERIRQVSRVTLSRIRTVLEQGINEGLGIEEIARNMERSNAVNRVRARVIARTEIVSASNEGTQLGAESTGLDLKKVWIATNDDRTRTDHALMDGVIVDMRQKFVVGPDEMKYPGDVDASAENVINCRCALAHETA